MNNNKFADSIRIQLSLAHCESSKYANDLNHIIKYWHTSMGYVARAYVNSRATCP